VKYCSGNEPVVDRKFVHSCESKNKLTVLILLCLMSVFSLLMLRLSM